MLSLLKSLNALFSGGYSTDLFLASTSFIFKKSKGGGEKTDKQTVPFSNIEMGSVGTGCQNKLFGRRKENMYEKREAKKSDHFLTCVCNRRPAVLIKCGICSRRRRD